MKNLIVISAPSGAGKTTLCRRLLARFPRLCLSISATTRAPRGEEKHGKEYFFMSREEFKELIKKDRFAEWALVHENYYGTSKNFIEETIQKGQAVLLDIDVQGAESLRKAYGAECLTVFIAPPSLAVLEKRLRMRGTDSEETIQKRLKNAQQEMQEAPKFEYQIVNDDLERAYQELETLLTRHLEETDVEV